MADITITGTIKVQNTTRTPGWIYAYPMTDFYLGLIGFQSSSPHTNDLPFKKIAVGAGAAGTGVDVGTTLYTFSIILPSTEDATVNPDGARFGLYVFDNASTPRLISEVSGLASARIPVTPTTHPAKDLALYNAGSLPPLAVNIHVTGTLDVDGLATFDDVVIGGTLNGQGIIGGAGVADRISYWTDSDTLASSPFLRIDSETVEQRGSGGANSLYISAGYVSDTDYARAVIYATTARVIYGIERDGDPTGIPVALLSYNGGDIQIGTDTDVWWDFIAGSFSPRDDTYLLGTAARPIGKLWIKGAAQWVNTSIEQVSLDSESIDTLSLIDSVGTYTARFKYGDEIYIQAIAGSPEGVVTASPGSIVSAETGAVYKKASGVGNTGWVELAAGSGVGYLVYRALLTQTGTGAPTAVVLENSLGGTVVWDYVSAGNYTATLASAFTADKTSVFMGSSWFTSVHFATLQTAKTSTSVVTLLCRDNDVTGPSSAYADDLLFGTEIKITVDP